MARGIETEGKNTAALRCSDHLRWQHLLGETLPPFEHVVQKLWRSKPTDKIVFIVSEERVETELTVGDIRRLVERLPTEL